jgi:hypothetical protein
MSALDDDLDSAGEFPSQDRIGNDYDLKFVPVDDGELLAGGWYRELPGAEIEVLSRAHLERVPLDDSDPEEKARETIAKMIKRVGSKKRR